MLVVSFSFSGVSLMLSFRMNDKGDVIGRFFFFLNAVRGNIVRIYVMSHWTVGTHCDADVFSRSTAGPQPLFVRVRNLRLFPSLEYDSSAASFSFHPDVKKTKQKKRQPPGHSALRFGGPPLTG